MAIFIVVATRTSAEIEKAIKAEGISYFPIKDDTWLVSWNGGISRELADKLGIRDGKNGPGFVALIGGYSGRLPKDAWEWMTLHESDS
jgi:hypothetical protein